MIAQSGNQGSGGGGGGLTGAVAPLAVSGSNVTSSIATNSIIGRITAGTGVMEVLTPAQVNTLLDVQTLATQQAAGTATVPFDLVISQSDANNAALTSFDIVAAPPAGKHYNTIISSVECTVDCAAVAGTNILGAIQVDGGDMPQTRFSITNATSKTYSKNLLAVDGGAAQHQIIDAAKMVFIKEGDWTGVSFTGNLEINGAFLIL